MSVVPLRTSCLVNSFIICGLNDIDKLCYTKYFRCVCEALGRVNHGEGRCYSVQLSNLRRMAVDLVGAILSLVMNHWVENMGGVIERFVFTFWYENVSVMSCVQSNVFVVVVWSHFSSQEKSSVLRKHTRIYSNYNIASWLWLEIFLEIQKRPIFSMTF